MRNTIAIIAGVISFASALPYIIDTVKGKTHPNLVTWITWALLNTLSTLAALSTGSGRTALLSGAAALGTWAILIVGLKHGVKKYRLFDLTCLAAALVGIGVWKSTNNAGMAVAIALTVILIAALPTWHHAWVAPFAETWEGFAMGGVAGILTLFSLTNFTFVTLAYPIVFVFNSLMVCSIVLGRRRKLGSRSAEPVV